MTAISRSIAVAQTQPTADGHVGSVAHDTADCDVSIWSVAQTQPSSDGQGWRP